MTARIAAIVNPASGGGRTGKEWPAIQKKLETSLGPVSAYFTDAPARPDYLPAADLARNAVQDGASLIIAVGGDGTISETVNGLMTETDTGQASAQLALLNTGTGGDFRKTFDLPAELDACIARIASGTTRRVDLGRLSFKTDSGSDQQRYFDNIASFGLSGAVDRAINRARFSKLFGGAFAYQWATLKTVLRYKPHPVHIRTDGGMDETINVGTAAIANGKFFGGGMMMAPDAEPDDGRFDVVIMRDTTVGDLLKDSGSLYEGTHIENEKVSVHRASWIEAEPVGKAPVLLDIDGEAPGRLPARFDILPGALTLRL
ncbi:MAG: diacylglycerol kinase family lipid kinase [Parvibaculaceae bacterium]